MEEKKGIAPGFARRSIIHLCAKFLNLEDAKSSWRISAGLGSGMSEDKYIVRLTLDWPRVSNSEFAQEALASINVRDLRVARGQLYLAIIPKAETATKLTIVIRELIRHLNIGDTSDYSLQIAGSQHRPEFEVGQILEQTYLMKFKVVQPVF